MIIVLSLIIFCFFMYIYISFFLIKDTFFAQVLLVIVSLSSFFFFFLLIKFLLTTKIGIILGNNFFIFFHLLLVIIFLLISIAFFTLGERKLMGSIQRRKGPDVVGFWGLLQPLADGLKLLFKEIIFPLKSIKLLFIFGPLLIFVLSLISWIVIPFGVDIVFTSINLSILFIFILAGLNIYGLIISGWSSNSRYAFLGSIRATAQMISYELTFGMINIIIVFFAGSFNYVEIILSQEKNWFFQPLLPLFFFYLIVMLAETNRTPFDLAEAEAESVAGYNVEYSSMTFALFFLGEYANMLLLSVIGTIYFLGGWYFFGYTSIIIFICKILLFCIFFVWVRATLPRYRYDQLMELGWKYLLPLIFALLFFYIGIFISFDIAIISIYSLYFQQFNLFQFFYLII